MIQDNKPVSKPNFFILGAAKSGTTSLFHYLRQHPDIFMPLPKETNFFCDGFQGFYSIKRATTYFELLGEGAGSKLIGEASHSYLSSPRSAKTIKLLFPDAKFLLVLRNPADRAHSLYHHLRRYGHEKLSSFEKALEAEEWRINSSQFIKNCGENIHNVMYYRSGLYGEQIQRYFNYFNKEQFFITTLKEFYTNTQGVLTKIHQFLGVDSSFEPELEAYNVGSLTARFPTLNHFMTIKLKRGIRPEPSNNRLINGLKKVIFAPTPKISPETKNELMKKYQADQELLFQLTGITFNETRTT
jgi:hypothetical protein